MFNLNKIKHWFLSPTNTNETYKTITTPERDGILFINSLAILWLLIPYLIFIFTYYVFYLAIPTFLIVICFSKPVLRNLINSYPRLSWLPSDILPAILAAIIFTWLTGIIPPLGMGGDWDKHFTILNVMLEAKEWPPTLLLGGEMNFLRYNIALYEVPTLLEKLMPIGVHYWLALYETIGLALFFISSTYCINTAANNNNSSSAIKNAWIIFIIMGFSGLDIVGTLYVGQNFIVSYPHLDWWASPLSFSSNLNQYFEAPQHCLPAWLGTSLLYLNARYKGNILRESIFLLMFLIFFWSPLVFIGFLFLFTLFISDIIRSTENVSKSLHGGIMLFALFAPLVIYFKTDISSIPAFFIDHTKTGTLKTAIVFLIVEVFIYIALLFLISKDKFNKVLLANMALFFIMCALYHVGFVNELGLKSTMPALVLLALFLANALTNNTNLGTTRKVCRALLLITFIIGLATPASLIVRGFNYPRHPTSLNLTKYESVELNLFFIQYFAPVKNKPFFIRGNNL